MDKRKELRAQYKQRTVVGGVYRIVNTENGRYLLAADDDLRGSKNRFEFAAATGSCVMPQLQDDWKKYGSKIFAFEILEELEKKPEQTAQEFAGDLQALAELWSEKFNPAQAY